MGTLVRAGAVALACAAAGCTLRAGPAPVDAYAYSSPPPGIYQAPRAYYSGNTYYWHGDHWWYQSPRGWAYLREEPTPLYRSRPYVAQPPPAYPRHYGGGGYGGGGYGRPYGYGGGPPVPPPLPAPRR
jgi:hypothetical protein